VLVMGCPCFVSENIFYFVSKETRRDIQNTATNFYHTFTEQKFIFLCRLNLGHLSDGSYPEARACGNEAAARSCDGTALMYEWYGH